jgi:co-chaperonin GroES (HSP10)
MDIRPLHDRVVLKRDERQHHHPGASSFRIRRARSRPKAA